MKLLRSFLLLLVSVLFAWSSIQSAYAADKTAVITLSPSASSSVKGQTVTVQIVLNTGGQAVSGVDLSIAYSPNLSFTSFSEANSVFNAAVTNPSGNSPLRVARLRFDTGYNGSNGLIGTFTFTGTAAGPATVSVNSSSEVIAYSDATNIYSTGEAANFMVTESVTSASPTPTTAATSPSPANQNTENQNQSSTMSNSTTTANNTSSASSSSQTAKSSPSSKTTTPKASSTPSSSVAQSPTNETTAAADQQSTPITEASQAATTNTTMTSPTVRFSPVTFSTPTATVDYKTLVSPANLGALAIALLGLIALPFVILQVIRNLPKK